MKKLIAIVALAAGSAFGGTCGYTPVVETPKNTAWVYTWKFSGKTTAGSKIKAAPATLGSCGYTNGTAAKYVRTPASLKIQGYTYYCSPECGTTSFETIGEEMFYMTKPTKSYLEGGVMTEVANIIGKKANLCEIAGKLKFTEFIDESCTDKTEYDLTFAGIGKYDKKNSRIISASGTFSGTATPVWYVSKTECAEAGYWDCGCTGIKYDAPTVAFGKFSVKFHKGAATRYAEGKKVAITYPKWVQKQYAIVNAK